MNQVVANKPDPRTFELGGHASPLQANETQYKLFFDNNPLPMWVYDLETLRFLTVNHAATIQYGYSVDEFLQLTLNDIRPLEDIPLLRENIQQHHEIYQQSGPWRHRTRSGKIIYVEITSHEVLYDGRKGRLVLAQDVTQRKCAEDALRKSEAILKKAQRVANVGSWIWHIQSNTLEATEQTFRIFGKEGNVFQGGMADLVAQAIHPDDQTLVTQSYSLLLENKKPFPLEFRIVRPDGTERMVWVEAGELTLDASGFPLTLSGVVQDISERKTIELKLQESLKASQQRLQRIEVLHDIDLAISANTRLDPMLGILLEKVKAQLQVDAVDVLLYDEAKNQFRYAASRGFDNPRAKKGQELTSSGLAAAAASGKEIIRIACLHKIELAPDFKELVLSEGFTCYYGIPLIATGRVIGVLELFHSACLDPDPEWYQYFHALAGQAAVAIENSQLIEGLKRANCELTQAYDATIAGWSLAMDLRDKETEGHTQRVTQMTVALARKLGLGEKEIQFIRRGALLHDIGKIGIPDSILLKPGILSNEERLVMQQHPRYAYEMLKSIDYLKPALDIPHLHHEKWDGSGYPYGLKGEEIPLAARIFAIVDVFDALTSDRPYRKAWSEESATAHLKEEKGKHFDPTLVGLFLEFLAEERAAKTSR